MFNVCEQGCELHLTILVFFLRIFQNSMNENLVNFACDRARKPSSPSKSDAKIKDKEDSTVRWEKKDTPYIINLIKCGRIDGTMTPQNIRKLFSSRLGKYTNEQVCSCLQRIWTKCGEKLDLEGDPLSVLSVVLGSTLTSSTTKKRRTKN